MECVRVGGDNKTTGERRQVRETVKVGQVAGSEGWHETMLMNEN